MVSIKFYLDTRKSKSEESPCPLRINITKKGAAAAIPTGIKITPRQWNKEAGKVQNHPKALLYNRLLNQKYLEVETIVLKLEEEEDTLGNMSATQIRDCIIASLNPEQSTRTRKVEPKTEPVVDATKDTFLKWYDRFTARKQGCIF